MKEHSAVLFLGLFLVMGAGCAFGGTLDSPAPPSSTNSAMYSVNDVYNRLATGAAGALRAGAFAEPAAAPGPTGHTLNEVMGKAPAVDSAAGAVQGDVLAGKTYWGLTSNQWGRQTGSIPVQAVSPATAAVPAGYYAATNLTQTDADLATGNIRAGVTVFGVGGKTEVVDTASGDAAAADIMAGRKAWVDGAEVTGALPTQVLSPATAAVPAGYYAATNLTQTDADLATGNIRAGVTVFGVSGKAEVVDTASGDAAAADIMAGRKAWVDGAEVTGALPTQVLSPATVAVPAGYYAATNLTQTDADLATGNIRAGVTVFGVSGKTEVVDTASGDAAAADIMAGRKAWVDGAEVTGALPTQVLSPATAAVPAGYYAATNLTQTDADLATGNIRAGVTVFGVGGKLEVVDTASGDAAAADIMAGRKAWVDGAEVTGALPTQVLSPATAAVPAGYYAATNLTQTDADLATGNIRAGVTVFGVGGKIEVVDTASGDAAAADIMAGRKAWVDGAEVTGALPTQVLSPATVAVPAGYYAATNLAAVDADLLGVNIRSGISIFGVAGDPNVVNTGSGDATAADILDSRRAWVDGVQVIGAMPSQFLSAGTTNVPAGYYASSSLSQVDTDLSAGNIRSGVSIFGIAGTRYAPVADTGQRTLYATGDDGDLEPGVAWPATRFTRGDSGPATNTVVDNLTGLVWAWDAQVMGVGALTNWVGAVDFCNSLTYGGRSDWRLPTRFELESLLDLGQSAGPILPASHPFTNTMPAVYWTSTTYGAGSTFAWTVGFSYGLVDRLSKTGTYRVWPVAGGE